MPSPDETSSASSPPTPAGKRPGKRRIITPLRLLWVFVIVVGTSGAVVALSSAMSALRWMGVLFSGIVATLIAVVLPLVLVYRLGRSLWQRGRGPYVWLPTASALMAACHLAIIGMTLQWVGRSEGDLAAAAHQLLQHSVGGVWGVSGVLKKVADENGALAYYAPSDGGPRAPSSRADGGVPQAGDAGRGAAAIEAQTAKPQAHSDAGAGSEGSWVHGAPTVDAGMPNVVAVAPTPALSARAEGGAAVAAMALSLKNDDDSRMVSVTRLYAKGAAQTRLLSLKAFRGRGNPTALDVANDGNVVVLLGNSTVLRASPKGELTEITALHRGTKTGSDVILGVDDVAIGPGGAILATVELHPATGEAVQNALVGVPGSDAKTVEVGRRSGAPIPGAPDKSVSLRFLLKRAAADGSIAVVEEFAAAGTTVAAHLSGKTFSLNPQRLLVGQIDVPVGFREVARSKAVPNGLDGWTLQAFQDAAVLADGRVYFDANFMENSRQGWLFQVRRQEPLYAVAAGRFGQSTKPGPKAAPWMRDAPRLRFLAAESEGGFAFLNAAGVLVTGTLEHPETAKPAAKNALLYDDKGVQMGTVERYLRPTLAEGGGAVLALVVAKAQAGNSVNALILQSRSDLAAGVGQVVLMEGTSLPSGSTKIRQLRPSTSGRDPLWLVSP